MNVPEYETDEILEKNLLIAVRNCGNIDLDGDEGDNINMEDDVRPSDDGPVHRGEQVAHDDDERRPEIPSWSLCRESPKECKPEEIMSDQSKVQRSQTTGWLMITLTQAY